MRRALRDGINFSVPASISSQDIPIGMQIIDKPGDTQTVLRVAYAFGKVGPKPYTGDLFPKFN
jgi:amidase